MISLNSIFFEFEMDMGFNERIEKIRSYGTECFKRRSR